MYTGGSERIPDTIQGMYMYMYVYAFVRTFAYIYYVCTYLQYHSDATSKTQVRTLTYKSNSHHTRVTLDITYYVSTQNFLHMYVPFYSLGLKVALCDAQY